MDDGAAFFAIWIWPLAAAILGGIISGIIVVIAIKYLQTPNLVVSLANDRYDEPAEQHYVHLRVWNRKTRFRRFVGGGTAVNCRCTLTLRDGRSFVTKWATREPFETKVAFDATGKPTLIRISDQAHIERAKLEDLRPGEEKLVDVAVRLRGDSSCYIHQPENFLDPNYRPRANEVRLGEHDVTAVLTYNGGTTNPFRFTISNREGDTPGLLRLEDSA